MEEFRLMGILVYLKYLQDWISWSSVREALEPNFQLRQTDAVTAILQEAVVSDKNVISRDVGSCSITLFRRR